MFGYGGRYSIWLYFFFLLSSWNCSLVQADFGDYVDSTYQCPARTTCPRVCVANSTDCPPAMQCADNLMLCADGSCAEICNPSLISPCPYECASVACPKAVDTLPNCLSLYESFYENEPSCGEEEDDSVASATTTTTLLTFTEPIFIFGYTWISVLIFLVLGWTHFNQRISRVAGSTQAWQVGPSPSAPQAPQIHSQNDAAPTRSWQTGYRTHAVGRILHGMTLITSMGWIGLLIWISIQYYVQDGNPHVENRKVHIQDQVQLLQIFIVVWNAGLVWFLAWKWPYNMQSVFFRRCVLSQATHVAVYMADPQSRKVTDPSKRSSNRMLTLFSAVLSWVLSGMRLLMSWIFADSDQYGKTGEGCFQYCRVQQDELGNRYFVFLFRRYNFDYDSGTFVPGYFEAGSTLGGIASVGKNPLGLTDEEISERRRAVGRNTMEMVKPSAFKVIIQEFSRPFYIYQLFIIFLWFPTYYYYMAFTWGAVVFVSASLVAWVHYRNINSLFRITEVVGECKVLREGSFTSMNQSELVPGDIVNLTPGMVYCDMVLVSSAKLLMDESALTGESFPQGKVPVDPTDGSTPYDRTLHKRHTISAGTIVLESDESSAVVLHTSSYTVKGELIREIFSSRRHQLKFETEVKIVVAILLLYATLGFIVVNRANQEIPVIRWIIGMYVVAAVFPALLPTVFTVPVGVADQRLASKRITCVNSERIPVAGKVKYAFFDKTGTLTKQGLTFLAANSSYDTMSQASEKSNALSLAMATCHTLTLSHSGLLVGNPVDRAMFKASGAKLINSSKKGSTVADRQGNRVQIVRYFDFDHHRMMQSVVVQLADGELVAFVKGSGESVRRICDPSSLPANLDTSLRLCAGAGIYQIMVASKVIDSVDDVNKLTRDEVESDLDFIGTLNFKNKMRKEAPKVIRQLTEGEVKCIMVTGDNVSTAICIARESGILTVETPVLIGSVGPSGDILWSNEAGAVISRPPLDQLQMGSVHLALYGQAWQAVLHNDPEEAELLMKHVRVYGRCTPHDKVAVVEAFVQQGHVTLMCGDGGNDCGALKAAHVSVALSDAEASMVSAFTSLNKSIVSVVDVIREGRCTLASSLAMYKYFIMYGQISTINILMTGYFDFALSEWAWVFTDGIWTISLALTLPLARPADRLSPTRPTASLLGSHTMASALGVLLLNFSFTMITMTTLWHQDWFQCRKSGAVGVENYWVGDNFESGVMFPVTGYQYISTAMAFNFGYEFRQGWFRNYAFVALAFMYSFGMFFIALYPSPVSCFWRVNCSNENVVRTVAIKEPFPITNPFNTTVLPWSFRLKVASIMFFNAVAIAGYEYFVVNGLRQRWAAQKRRQQQEEVEKLEAAPEAPRGFDLVMTSPR